MPTKPRTKELCWKLIERLERENEAISDALHKMNNECAIVLSNKDRELEMKCKTCGRRLAQ